MGLDNALRVTFEALTHIGIQTRVSASIAGQGVVPTKASILVCTVADVFNRSFDDVQHLVRVLGVARDRVLKMSVRAPRST